MDFSDINDKVDNSIYRECWIGAACDSTGASLLTRNTHPGAGTAAAHSCGGNPQ